MTQTPEVMPEGPGVDVLSDVLNVVRLSGAVLFTGEFSAPWALSAPPTEELAPLLMPSARCLVLFHVVVEGRCWLDASRGRPLRLERGDVVILPHGDSHAMSSDAAVARRSVVELLPRDASEHVPRLVFGGGGDRVRLLCGFLHCRGVPFDPLLPSLPRVLRVASATSATAPWLARSVELLLHEVASGQPGSACLLQRLTELIFVEAIREHMLTLGSSEVGWLAGVRDPVVGRALSELHAHPAEPWTVSRLARRVGVSRSVLAERFRVLLDQPPMQYLARWRIRLAAERLRVEPGAGVAAVASSVGYESEAAFSRAFKRVTGESPTGYRTAVHAPLA